MTTADQLPEEGWLALVRELAETGEWRLALRAAFLATLARLAVEERIAIGKAKANREYREEVRRHSNERPVILARFAETITVYEGVWYGAHPTTENMLHLVLGNLEVMRTRG